MKDTLTLPYAFSTHTAPNRLVAQAMETNNAENGGITPAIVQRYRRLAEGGWGIVFAEALSITDRHLARDGDWSYPAAAWTVSSGWWTHTGR